MNVSKYMTQKVIAVEPGKSVKDAFLTMRARRVRHLPVVEGDKLIGIISDRDLRRPRWAESIDDWTSYYQIDDSLAVKDVMTSNPEVVHTYAAGTARRWCAFRTARTRICASCPGRASERRSATSLGARITTWRCAESPRRPASS